VGREAILIAHAEVQQLMYGYIFFCGRYELAGGPPIHHSATAVVIAATDHGDPAKPRVVLKLMKSEEQFQREVEIHCRIHHPNITKMYAYFHDASNCYLLLELADLGTLYSKVATGRLGEREAACIFRQLVCAVAHMHRRGVIHRDIKPENVFLNCGQAGDRDEVRGLLTPFFPSQCDPTLPSH
jgi:serine/threonine protein kinase